MKPSCRILFLENSKDDLAAIERELRLGGISFVGRRVDSRQGYLRMLREFDPDIILADYWLKDFDGLTALRLARVMEIDAPFILITGSTNEEVAVECIKAGASDYVLKDRPARLVPAVRTALETSLVRAQRNEAEERLKMEQARLRQITDHMLDLISQIDMDLHYSFVSPTHERLCGYVAKDLLGTSFLDYVHPDDRLRIESLANSQWRQNVSATTEFRYRNADGTYRWVEVVGSPIGGAFGPQSGIVLAAREISERKRIEEESKRQQAYLTYLSDSAMTFVDFPADGDLFQYIAERMQDLIGDGIVLVNSYDPVINGLETRAMSGTDSLLQRMLRFLGKDFIGAFGHPTEATLMQLMGGRLVELEGGLRQLAFSRMPKVLSNALSAMLEVSGIYSIGLVQKAQLFGNILIVPRGSGLTSERTVIETFAYQASVALQRRQVEKALTESEEMLQRLIATSPDGIAVSDLDGRLVQVNPADVRLLGYASASELIGRKSTDVIHPSDRERAAQDIVQMLKDGALRGIEYRMVRKDGSIFWAEQSTSVVTDAEGRPRYFMAVTRNVSDRKETEQALRESEQRFRELADLLPQPIFASDMAGRITFANRTAFRSFKFNEADFERGVSIVDAVVPEDRSRIMEAFQDVSAGHVAGGLGFRAVRKDGTPFPIMIYATSIRRNDRVVGVRGIIVDVTEQKAAEEAIRLSEERTRALVENANDAIMLADLETGILLEANARAAELTGRRMDDLVGMHLSRLYPAEESEKYREAFRRTAERRSTVLTDLYVQRTDGIRIPVDVSATVFTMNDRRVILGIFRDVRERHRAETLRRETQRKLEAIVDEAPFGAHLYELQEGNTLVFTGANRAADQILGIEHRTLIGKPIEEAFPGLVGTDIPDRYRAIASTGGRYITEQISYDHGEISGSYEVHAFQTETGQLAVFFRDVTERTRSEQALQKSEAKYRLLFNAMSDAIMVHPILPDGLPGTFIEVNDVACERLGYSREELLHMRPLDIDAPEGAMAVPEAMRRLLSEGHAVWEGLHVTKDGRTIPVEIVNHLLPFGEGKIALAAVRDISERKRAEDALRASERVTRYIVKHAPFGIVVFDTHMRYLSVSDRFLAENDLREEEILGKNHYEIIPGIATHWKDAHERCLRGAVEGAEAEPYPRADGSVGYSRWECRPWYDMNGEIGGIVLYVEDITRRMKAEEALRKLSRAVEQSPSSIMITDANGTLEYVNPKFCQVTGYAAEEVIGKNPRFLKSGLMQKEDYRILWETLRSGKEWHGELLNRKKNNELFFEAAAIMPIVDAAGRITHFLAVKEDITQRKRMEQSLRDSEERYRTFFEEDLAGAFISSPDGVLAACNPSFARIFGFEDPEEAKTSNLFSLFVAPRYREELVQRLRVSKKIEYEQLEGRRSDGTHLSLIQSVSGTFNEKGELSEIKGYVIDTTDQRTSEEHVRPSPRTDSLGALAGGIAHDFNNILNTILGFAGQIKKYAADQAKVSRYCETIEKSALRGAELATNLLTASRHQKQRMTATNLGPIVNDVERAVRETLPPSVTVEVSVEDLLLDVRGDQVSLVQAILSLCQNAVEAMPTGGLLKIRARNRVVGSDVSSKLFRGDAKQCVEVQITDTGEGISAEIRDRIFEPFFTTRDKGKGSGLGLAVVYNVARDHGGTILVESEVGKGTAMTMLLPAIEHVPTGRSSASTPPLRRGNNELILLADDEESMRDLGKELLEDLGYRVIVASDGVRALDAYRRHREEIVLVILDLIMPEMDGGQTFAELRKLDPNVKAIFCSGFTGEKAAMDLSTEQNVRAIQKPFHPADFVRTVQDVLTGTR